MFVDDRGFDGSIYGCDGLFFTSSSDPLKSRYEWMAISLLRMSAITSSYNSASSFLASMKNKESRYLNISLRLFAGANCWESNSDEVVDFRFFSELTTLCFELKWIRFSDIRSGSDYFWCYCCKYKAIDSRGEDLEEWVDRTAGLDVRW